jgi:hypothetical protein
VSDLPWTAHLVAHTPELHAVRFRVAVGSPQIAPLRSSGYVAIFHQRGRILRGSRTEVQPQQWLCPDKSRPRDELIRPKLVCLQRVPRAIEHGRTLVLRAHAIQPGIPRQKISTRPPHNRHAQLAHFFCYVGPESVLVREVRAWIIDALINRASQLLQK